MFWDDFIFALLTISYHLFISKKLPIHIVQVKYDIIPQSKFVIYKCYFALSLPHAQSHELMCYMPKAERTPRNVKVGKFHLLLTFEVGLLKIRQRAMGYVLPKMNLGSFVLRHVSFHFHENDPIFFFNRTSLKSNKSYFLRKFFNKK